MCRTAPPNGRRSSISKRWRRNGRISAARTPSEGSLASISSSVGFAVARLVRVEKHRVERLEQPVDRRDLALVEDRVAVAGVLVEDEPSVGRHAPVDGRQHGLDLAHVVERAEEADEVERRVAELLRRSRRSRPRRSADASMPASRALLAGDLDRFRREVERVDPPDLARARHDELVVAGAAGERERALERSDAARPRGASSIQ